MDAKPLWKSKEFWFHTLLGTANVLAESGILQTIPQPWGVVAQGVGGVLLRAFFTAQPVTVAGAVRGPAADTARTLRLDVPTS